MTEPTQEQIKALEERLAREPQSPLFARLAAYYISQDRAQDALRLCDDGLAHFPFYATAHLVKGNVLAKLGMMAEARREYEVVHEFMPTSETALRLWTSIDLGAPGEGQAPAVVEETVELAEPEASVEEIPVPEAEPVASAEIETPAEETVVAEAPHVPEEIVEEAPEPEAGSVAPVEESVAPEEEIAQEASVEVQPETAPAVEDAFGFPVEPAAPEETPVAEDAFGMTPEPTAAETLMPGEEPVAGEGAAEPRVEEPILPEADFGFGEVQETQQPDASAEMPAAEPEASAEDAFGMLTETPQESTEQHAQEPVAETSESTEGAQPEWMEAFSQLQQPAEETATAPEAAPEENPFGAFGGDESTPVADAESYEDYTARIRMELFGTENTMTLEQYLSGSETPETGTAEPDQIGDLAEKLKNSPRITPPVINFAEKSGRTASDVDAVSDSGFVTPTLAEIYVKQGWYDDAIKAYKTLAAGKPEDREKHMKRIAEIEEMKKSSG